MLAGSWGCALRGPAPVPPEQRAAYDAAMGHLPADPRAAEVALEAFLATHPRGPWPTTPSNSWRRSPSRRIGRRTGPGCWAGS
ncbi:MAG: hypothetical protein R3E53_09595 [Myxococcota bacterium]